MACACLAIQTVLTGQCHFQRIAKRRPKPFIVLFVYRCTGVGGFIGKGGCDACEKVIQADPGEQVSEVCIPLASSRF